MSFFRKAALSWALLIASGLYGPSAQAEETRLSVAVRFQGARECDDPDAFWRALSERTTRVYPSAEDEASIVLDVQLKPSRRGVLGMLQIAGSGVATEPRYVEAQHCADVVQALALTAALGIDPDALTKVPENPPLPEPEEEEGPSIPWSWRGALEAGLIGNMAVDLEANLGVFGGVAAVAERPSVFAPKIRIGATASRTDLFDSAGSARFALTAISFDACPIRFGTEALALRTCATSLWGAIVGEGRNLTNGLDTRQTWFSIGPALQIEIQISRALHWQLDFAGHVPFFRQRYTQGLQPEQIATTLNVMPWLGLGLSYTP